MQVGTISGAGSQDTGVVISAVVYPACLCAMPWTAHVPDGVPCQGYRPSRPVVDFGTRAYSPPPRLAWWRKFACRLAWSVEVRLQHARERLDGTGG